MNLAEERVNRGLSLRQAGKAMGVLPNTLRRAERGEGIYPASAKKIADFYGVKVTDIWPLPEDDRALV